jgi:hypothetical protein
MMVSMGRAALAALMVTAAPAALAQEVSSTIRGTVVDAAGAPIVGATVVVANPATGTRTERTSDASGGFNVSGLRVGGPYEVTVTAAGQDAQTVSDIQTTIGQPYVLTVTLGAPADSPELIVTGRRTRGTQTGEQTTLDRDRIQGIASVNRDIRDLVRRDPLASFDPNPRGRAISIGGGNPRTNRFSIDGVTVNDTFGLNSGGLPSARGIVSLEAIDQVTVAAAPADITQGDLQGGAINATLRSGTNRFSGSGFFIYGADDIAGDEGYDNRRLSGAKVAPTSNRLIVAPEFKSFGAFLSGPIIRDTLFFATSYEKLEESQVNARGLAGEGAGTTLPFITRANVDRVRNIVQSRYGFDALDVPRIQPEKDEKLSAKVDWNIMDGQRFAATYIYHRNTVPRDVGNSESAANPSVGLESNFYKLGEETNAYTGQLNSQWSDIFSTELRYSRRDYERRQDPYGGLDFPAFEVCLDPVSVGNNLNCNAVSGNPSGRVNLGPDQFRQSNYLKVRNQFVTAIGEISYEGHVVKMLGEFGKANVFNLFVPSTSGLYYFDSIADLEAGRASQLVYANALTGNPNDAAAAFSYKSLRFGIQDSWQVTPSLGVIYGVRYEWLDSERPVLNTRFLNAYGFANTITPEKGVVQPRFAFNWRPDRHFTLSGGGGLFAGGTPDVWLSNSFSNDGTRQNSLQFQRTATGFVDATQVGALRNIDAALGGAALNNVTGSGIPSAVQQYLGGRGAPVAAAVGALAPGIRIASSWKGSLAASWDGDFTQGWLGSDWRFDLSALVTKVKDGFIATDLRTRRVGTLPDGRSRYDASVGSNSDILLQNTGYGRGIVLAGGITKQLGGLTAAVNYTFQDINDVGSFTGFTPTELYGVATVDPNRAPGGRSSFETRHLGKIQLGYRTNLWSDNEFRIDLFGESRSGRPFSYTFTDVTPGRSAVFGTIGGGGRYLFYVPDFSQAATVNAAGRPQIGNVEFASQAALDGIRSLVDGSKLRRHYGSIAPRNLGDSPSYTKLDLRVQQALPLPLGAKFRVFADVENVLNLLNRNWNSYKVFSDSVSIANVACVAEGTNTCARYLYSNPNDQTATTFQSASLWQMRIGARIDF